MSWQYGSDVSEHRRGFLLGVAAYAMWGLFPLYWPLLEPAGAVEILAHRVVWSLVTMVVLTVVLRRTSYLRAIMRDRRVVVLLAVASVVIAFNWGGFIYGVNHDRVVEVSLGYFINPLVTVLLGVFVLGETAASAAVGRDRHRGGGGGHPDRRLRTPAVDRVAARRVVRHLRPGQEEGGRRRRREPDLRDDAARTARAGVHLWLAATGESNFASHGVGHAVLLSSDRPGHGRPADLLRRRRDPDPDDHAGPAAVPRPDHPVRAGPGGLRRGDDAR